jgi:hypothetical protein
MYKEKPCTCTNILSNPSELPGKLARGQGEFESRLERFGGYDKLLWFGGFPRDRRWCSWSVFAELGEEHPGKGL